MATNNEILIKTCPVHIEIPNSSYVHYWLTTIGYFILILFHYKFVSYDKQSLPHSSGEFK